jgi:hypothetical protein
MVHKNSVEAYREAFAGQKFNTQRANVMRAILTLQNNNFNLDCTRRVLSVWLTLPINCVCGRVNELLKAGVIKEGQNVKCATSGKMVATLLTLEAV